MANHRLFSLKTINFSIKRKSSTFNTNHESNTMKKLLLIFFLAPIFALGQICTIDYTQTQTGIYPDTLPVGYVGQPYDTDITFVMPLDTLGYAFTNFYIMSVSLPVGLSWECNSVANNCNYNPQVSQHGCVNISGTPLLPGTYSVFVSVIADLTVVQGYPFQFEIFMEVLPSNVSTTNNGFSMVGAAGCSPITVGFTNNNPGLLAYEWDFGNGNISTLENPVPQVYTTPGDYIVEYTAWNNLDTINVFTLTNVGVTAMSNYGGGFPSFETPDAYFVLKENGTAIYQSSIIGDQNPPVNWSTSINLNPNNTYVIEIWDADDTFGEILFGADDYMGNHTMMFSGCTGCAAGTSTINYTINQQVIYPNPSVLSVDTIHVYGYPADPVIAYDNQTNIINTPDLGLSYQWYLNNSPINGATNPEYTVYQSGVYHVVAINTNGCVSFSDTLTAVYCDPDIQPEIDVTSNGSLLVATEIPLGYTIQWYLNDFAINGQTNDTLSLLMSGSYEVAIVDSFGCVHTSAPLSVGLSVDELQTLEWSVFPNPANDWLELQWASSNMMDRIEILDNSGRIIASYPVSSPVKQSIQIAELTNGMYWIRLSSGNVSWSKQFVKN